MIDHTELGMALFWGRDQAAGQGHYRRESRDSSIPASTLTLHGMSHPAEQGTPAGEHAQRPAHPVGLGFDT